MTTLSGDIGTPGEISDNTFTVVKINTTLAGLVDGFTITQGNETTGGGAGGIRGGGGIQANGPAEITSCTITNNNSTGTGTGGSGGGIFIGDASVDVRDCVITDNLAKNYGGGICSTGAGAIINCTITDNDTTLKRGGGVAFFDTDKALPSKLVNCTILANTAGGDGGGVGIEGCAALWAVSRLARAAPRRGTEGR